MAKSKKQSIANTVTNGVTTGTADRLGDGKVVPIQRPKNKKGKLK